MRTRLLFSVLLAFSIAIHAQTANTVLWRISGNHLKAPSYVYGTMHIKDKRVFYADDSLVRYINSCELFANELHPDSLNALLFKVLNQRDTTADPFKKTLSEDEYDLVNKKLQKDAGINLNQLKTKDFRYIKMLLSPTRRKSDDYPTFLDGYLMALAKRENKTLVGLENIRSQEGAINTLISGENYKKEIVDMSRGDGRVSNGYEDLIKIYQEGNVAKIQEKTASFSFELEEGLLTHRNKFMARTIDSLVKEHTLFATCGAAHLGGKGGVLQLLRDMGYIVTPIIAAKRSYLNINALPPNFNSWQVVSTPALGVSYSLPGAPVSYYKNVFYSDMKMYPDMGTGCCYTILPISITVGGDDKQAVFDTYADRIKARLDDNVIKSEKRIVYNGMDGLEIEYGAAAGNNVRLRLLTNNNILYSFSVTYPANSDNKVDIDHFFNSVTFFKPVKGETYSYYNARWGFKIELPAKPDEKKDISKAEGARIEILSLKSSDNISQIHYLIECTESGEGRFYPQDSILLRSLSRRFSEDKHVTLLKDSAFTLQGARCNETKVYYDDQSSLVNWSILRGFRYYDVMAIMSKSTQEQHLHDAIFRSLAFDPSGVPDFKPYAAPQDSLLIIDLPQPFKAAPRDDENSTDTLSRPVYRSYDPQTAITYYLQEVKESPYYYTIPDSMYWKNIEDRFVNYSDTLLASFPSSIKQVPAHEFIVKNKYKSVIRHYMTLNFGTYHYNIYAYLPQENMSPRWEYPFTHLRYAGTLSPKTASDTAAFRRMVHDLASPDSAVNEYASNHFYKFKLTDQMMDQLERVIASPAYKTDSTGEHFDLKENFINKLSGLHTERVFNFVSGKLQDPETPRIYLPDYVRVLASFKTAKSYTILKQYFASHTGDVGDYSGAIYLAQDSLQLAAMLYPEILETLIPDSTDNYALQNLTNNLLDSGLLSYQLVLKYEPRIINKSLEYTKQKTDREAIFASYYIDNLAAILSHSPHEALINEHYRQLLASKNIWCRYAAACYLIKRNQPVDKKILESLAGVPYLRNKLFTELEAMKHTELMPGKYRDQQNLAEANLYSVAYDNDEAEISHAKFIKTMPVVYKGKNAMYYLFKVSFKDSKSKYLGIAGPYDLGEASSNQGDNTAVYYSEEYKKGKEAEMLSQFVGE